MDVEEKQQESESTEINIGALLVEARENQNLSAQDIADQLNLTVVVVEKIENNEFDQDIPLAFIRGYVRSYGQKVGVDLESLCAEFDRQTQKNEAPIQNIKRISPFGEKRREVNSNSPMIKVITYLIVGAIVALGGWEVWKRVSPKFLKDDPESTEFIVSDLQKSDSDKKQSSGNEIKLSSNGDDTSTKSTEVDASKVAEQKQKNESEGGEKATDSIVEKASIKTEEIKSELVSEITEKKAENDEDIASSDQTAEKESESASEEKSEVLAGPMIEATFTFSDDCWVQVTDANGEVLAIGTKQSGKVMPLKGIAPWNVILGEPSVVTMTKNGEEYDLSGYGAGRTAKFVLE